MLRIFLAFEWLLHLSGGWDIVQWVSGLVATYKDKAHRDNNFLVLPSPEQDLRLHVRDLLRAKARNDK